MKIALAQIDPTVGDFTGNLEKIVAASRRAAALGARLTVFSELAICGYPPADFLEKPSFPGALPDGVEELCAATSDFPRQCWRAWRCLRRLTLENLPLTLLFSWTAEGCCWSSTSACCRFMTSSTSSATFLQRTAREVVELDGVRLAITICEDAWNDKNFWPRRLYSVDPVEELMRQNPAIHINLSSSPFWHSKRDDSPRDAGRHGAARQLPGADVQPGRRQRQPDLRRLVAGAERARRLIAQAASFEEDLLIVDPLQCADAVTTCRTTTPRLRIAPWCSARAITCASAAFQKALVALSGGIDSALVAAIASGGARPGKCDWRWHAQPLFLCGLHRRQPQAGRESWHPL